MVSDDKLQGFLTWCRNNGIFFEGLEIRACEKSGNGVFATKFFQVNEKLIEVPKNLMITAGKIADMQKIVETTWYRHDVGDLFNFRFIPTPFELLTLFFCLEDTESSLYAPYLDMLPKSFSTPSYLNKYVDIDHLPSSVRKYWCIQQKDLQEIWEKIHRIVPQISHSKFLWAWHVVNTRCIYVENKTHEKVDNSDGDTLAVIPFVDMLNHDPCAKCLAMFESYSDKYVVRATHCVLEDQELTVCYGSHDNCRLWMEYGFTLPDNPNGKVVVEQSQFIELAKSVGLPVSSQHEQALYSAALPWQAYCLICHYFVISLYLSDEKPSWALWTNMKILMLPTSDLKHWRDIIYGEHSQFSSNTNDHTSEAVVQKMAEYRMLEKIITELKRVFAEMLTAVPEDIKWIWEEQLLIVNIILSSFMH
ncbi:SET domain protein [Dictyocaulus viviparus]|uniref:SET domain protein n=1 Tax=Dictyocaulus viviparus TaxID=29172 RepID=A0A0D8XU08_DICVI|nr:SET domain protein [Dictyocaulus viviparus]